MNQNPTTQNQAPLTPEGIKELKDKFKERIGVPPRSDMFIEEIMQALTDDIEEVKAGMRLKELEDNSDAHWSQR